MSKKILFCTLFILIFLIPSKQDPNAKIWPPHSKIQPNTIIAAIKEGEDVIIDSCEIYGMVIGGSSENLDTIKGRIQITNSVFYGGVLIAWCHFLNQLRFADDSFKEDVLFVFNVCNLWVIFARDTFVEMAAISENTFNEMVSFEETMFNKNVLFTEDIFQKGCNFREAKFKEEVDFSFSKFQTIGITWKQLAGHLLFYPPLHSELIKCFEQQRQLDDADDAYLFLKDQERMQNFWLWRYLEYWFIQQTCGYGVKPRRTLIVSLLIILVFSAFYTKTNAIREIEKEFRHRRRRRRSRTAYTDFRQKLYDALYFSVHTFIIGIVSDWHPTDEFLINTRKIKLFKFRTLSMIEGALGWILLVLFVVTLTRKFIR